MVSVVFRVSSMGWFLRFLWLHVVLWIYMVLLGLQGFKRIHGFMWLHMVAKVI